MAKDYFQDIKPPGANGKHIAHHSPARAGDSDDEVDIPIRSDDAAPRGIRNISAPRSRMSARGRMGGDMRVPPPPTEPPRAYEGEASEHIPGRSRGWLLWGIAILGVLVVGGLALFAFRATTVIVIPKSHAIVFDESSTFTAYPEASTPTDALSYSVQVSDIEDSEVVASQGTTHAETKASGSITVYNNFSGSSVKLIKNTRFSTSDGLIFRVPAEVIVPGKKGSTPGTVTVTVIADQAGEKYNIAPTARFTLPGLKSTADMYANVYGKSTAAFTGGFIGDQPAVAPGALDTALSSVRARLESKARAAENNAGDSSVVFPELIQITYQDLPNTTEAGGGVRIHEKAHVQTPLFPADLFAQTVAKAVSADAEGAPIKIIPGNGFGATFTTSSPSLDGPLSFTLAGQAQLVWQVDTGALAQALAGRDNGAFQTIVNGFSGIQEARARIEPFWKTTFPTNAGDIKIKIEAPKASQ